MPENGSTDDDDGDPLSAEVTLDAAEFSDAVKEFAAAAEQLEDAANRLQAASIRANTTGRFNGEPMEVTFNDLFDLEIAINISRTDAPTVYCPLCGAQHRWGDQDIFGDPLSED
jgi:hypothetical protein